MSSCRKLIQEIQGLFFPPLCLGCEELMEKTSTLFCEDCRYAMQLLDPKARCRRCFAILDDPSSLCAVCKRHCHSFRFASVFSYDSPASALVKELKYGAQRQYAFLMASFMVVQLRNLDFPWPDALIPVPQSLPRRLIRGYNPSQEIAVAMSRLMRVPVLHPLKRCFSSLPQSGKNAMERTHMPQEFSLCSASVASKALLLVDDVITTGTTLSRCAEALAPAYPASLHGLSFCLA